MSKKPDQRLQLTIPYPSDIPRNRGIHAVHRSTKLVTDCSIDEQEMASEAAALVGVSRSTFVRWVVTMAAKEIINAHQDLSQ